MWQKLRVLFWNTHKNELINPILCDIIIESNASIVVLAEYTADMKSLIELLDLRGVRMLQYSTLGCERIHILGVYSLSMEPLRHTYHESIQIINNDIIMCCIHLNSQIYSNNEEIRNEYIRQIINDLIITEKDFNSKNSIIVGDFNINPYDKSCISAVGFHGLPIYTEAKRGSRIVADNEYYMFYNPMWNFLGDFKKPYGTYYHNPSDMVNTYWNIFDQVIIRPALRERFIDESLQIITGTKTISLLNNNDHPDKNISDHLPILFEIREDNHG